jgi:hypothetical protein
VHPWGAGNVAKAVARQYVSTVGVSAPHLHPKPRPSYRSAAAQVQVDGLAPNCIHARSAGCVYLGATLCLSTEVLPRGNSLQREREREREVGNEAEGIRLENERDRARGNYDKRGWKRQRQCEGTP